MKRHAIFLACTLLAVWVLGTAGCDDDGTGNGALVADGADGGSDADGDGLDGMSDPNDGGGDDATEDVPDEGECERDVDCDDGLFCNGAERCVQGTCFDSPRVPCGDTLDCTVDECDEDEDRCTFEADDSLCPPGEVCDLKAGCFAPRECTVDTDCDDGLFCNGEETCGSAGTCEPGTPIDCNDGVGCTLDTCVEELGSCQSVPEHTLCLPTELCNLIEDCTPRPPCTRDDDCDDASFCNGIESCDVDTGECVPGEPPVLDDGVECTIDVCSEELAQVLHTPSAARCSDGLFCNGAEVCHPVDGCQEGEPPVLSDAVGCTVDRCNEDLDFIEHVPDDGACGDGLFCNGDEVCHPVDGCQPGEPVNINDGIGCTTDSCDEVNDTVVHTPSNQVCDDGLFCNGAEVCDAELDCVAGTSPVEEAEDGIECTTALCDEENDVVVQQGNDGLCSDGLFCNGDEVCDVEQGCVAGAARVIDDGVGCTSDSCDEENDVIVHAPDDGVCDDGAFCNGAEVCDPQQDCVAGVAPVVNDGIGCTQDTCDEVSDTVVHVPSDEACNDGLFCNGAEVCDAELDCVAGAAPVLDDGVGCTQDSCDEANDVVVHAPNNAVCSDGAFCNGQEVCDPQQDCVAGLPVVLDDGVGCTADSCDEENDVIVHVPNNGACNDGLFCNGAEVCDPQQDCVAGAAPSLDDGVGCTSDTCDEENDVIVHVPNNGACDDGAFCNGAEVCDPQQDCVAGAAPVLDDGVPCTEDSCDEDADEVVHVPRNVACDDGELCNGAEVCDPQLDCIGGQAPEDGLECGGEPRQICLKGDCEVSECGDRFVDLDNGEQCDSTPGCTDECLLEDGGIDYEGDYAVEPDPAYSCAFGLVNFSIERFIFGILGNTLRVIGAPANMTQSPVPNDGSFDVEGTLFAQGFGCDEVFRLQGNFTNSLRWTGTFTLTFIEPGTGNQPCQVAPALGCANQTWTVSGRQIE